MSLTFNQVSDNQVSDNADVAVANHTGIRVWKWTSDDFHRATQIGFFEPEKRFELFEGEVIEQMGENPPHASAIRRCRIALEQIFEPMEAFLSIQSPIVLSDESEPEPDLSVIRGEIATFDTQHPTAEDVLLLVEVSDATLAFDRGRKAARYAQAGIEEYWILNLVERRLEAYRMPQGGNYQVVLSLGESQTISPIAAPQNLIAISRLFPATG